MKADEGRKKSREGGAREIQCASLFVDLVGHEVIDGGGSESNHFGLAQAP